MIHAYKLKYFDHINNINHIQCFVYHPKVYKCNGIQNSITITSWKSPIFNLSVLSILQEE